jgi:hypothetical protein
VPFALGMVLWRAWRKAPLFGALVLALAGPWYARNLSLYGSLTGLQDSARLVPREALFDVASKTNWPAALLGMAHGGLWCGNASFTTFSAATLNAILALLVAGWLLWGRQRAIGPAQWLVAGGTLLFSAIPLYAMLLFGAMQGRVHPAANSWYTAAMLPGALLVAAAGFASRPAAGKCLARLLMLLAAYVVAATFFAKLIPHYAGFEGPARGGFLYDIYVNRLVEALERLGETAMAGGAWIVLLASLEVLFAVFLCVRLWRNAA